MERVIIIGFHSISYSELYSKFELMRRVYFSIFWKNFKILLMHTLMIGDSKMENGEHFIEFWETTTDSFCWTQRLQSKDIWSNKLDLYYHDLTHSLNLYSTSWMHLHLRTDLDLAVILDAVIEAGWHGDLGQK